jgi:RNA polymerase sigma factor (sigma-70 family)
VVTGLSITEIIKHYNNRLRRFIGNRVSSLEDAEDVLQDVYYQLSLADMLMKPVDQLNAWLFTVARNKITDFYRKKKTLAMPEKRVGDNDEFFEELQEILIDNDNNPESEYLSIVIWDEINKALDELPKEQKDVFIMTEMEGYSFKEIAKQTGEPVNTLISRKRYAVLYLRERLNFIYKDFLNI